EAFVPSADIMQRCVERQQARQNWLETAEQRGEESARVFRQRMAQVLASRRTSPTTAATMAAPAQVKSGSVTPSLVSSPSTEDERETATDTPQVAPAVVVVATAAAPITQSTDGTAAD